jgi:hypothetical protein
MQPLQSSQSAWKEVIDGDHQETSISSKLDAEGGEVFFVQKKWVFEFNSNVCFRC